MDTNTTRRGLLGGAGLASVALVVPAVAAIAAIPARGQVEAAWAEWWAAMDAMSSGPEAEAEDSESPVWQRINAAGKIIETSSETGPRVAEIRLWFYLSWVITKEGEWAAVRREDANWLIENFKRSDDYADHMALIAIKALRGEA